MNPDVVTKLILNNSVIVEVSSDYEDSVMITISDQEDDTDLKHRTCQLKPDEIDLFISILTLYKNRIKNP